MKEKMYEEYSVLSAQIRALTSQRDNLKDEILIELIDSPEQTVDLPVGKFTVSRLKTWTYTPKVTELEEAFKAQKATEQSTGEAKYEEKPSLRFSEVKF